MRFDGQAAHHCNCHLLCMKATLCASNEALALRTSILLFTPVDTYVPKKEDLNKGVRRLAELPARNEHDLEEYSAPGSIIILCLRKTLDSQPGTLLWVFIRPSIFLDLMSEGRKKLSAH